MQQSTFSSVASRVAGVLAFAACTSVAWAGPQPDAGQPAVQATAAQQPAAPQAVAQDGTVQDGATALAASNDALGFGPAAELSQLEQSRGGTDMHSDMKLDGVVAGNNAVNVVTGNNTIDSGSFANMSGIPVVIQNSGANVLIQSATIVNLQFQ
jgi:hypothetical protein